MSEDKNITFDDALAEIRKYITNEDDIARIVEAFEFANSMHEGQFRKSGEPYIVHIIHVAFILAGLRGGPQTIIAGILHDVIEDTDITDEEFTEKFGEEIFAIVEGVTKIGNLKFDNLEEYQAENHRKIFIAMANDIRVIIVKLVDRLHNMRTLKYMPEDKQKRIAQETLDVYAPIAHRLGMFEIKNELEDLCFYYLDRERYYEIAKMVEVRRTERDTYVTEMITTLDEILSGKNINFKIFGRSKHLFSINRKMDKKNIAFDEILDLLAIRVITKTDLECYEVLGYIHSRFTPVPGRLKDYIAMPKFNMYQSLHTTVIGVGGNIFEIQIRTEEMDEVAEKGVAAHWRYKEGSEYNAKDEQAEIEEKLHWFRDIINLTDNTEISDATEFMQHLQDDLFNTSVYVMSPQGRVIDLPIDSTPIDFAYRIHSEIGNKAVGATVNGNLVPLSTKLKTGDVVEIRTSKQSTGPNDDWLSFVKTSTARSRIKSFYKKLEKEEREPVLERGKLMWQAELKKREEDPASISTKKMSSVLLLFGISSLDDFYYAIGSNSLSMARVAEKLFKGHKQPEEIRANKQTPKKLKDVSSSKFGVMVAGLDSMMISLAQCCNPVKGDVISGYVTKGQGVTVHRTNCINVVNEKERLINCEWVDNDIDPRYESIIIIEGAEKNNLVADIIQVVSQNKASLLEINSRLNSDNISVTATLKVTVKDLEHLNNIIVNMNKVEGIHSVSRKGEIK